MNARTEAMRWLAIVISDLGIGKYPLLVETDFMVAADKVKVAIAELKREEAAITEPETKEAA